MTAALILAVVLALAAVLVVALPFLREPEVRAEDDRLAGATPAERRRLQLAEERDRALAALSELEFDHRTGKVSDEDYAELVGPLRGRAAATLRALAPSPRGPAPTNGATPQDVLPAEQAVLRDTGRARS